MDSIERWRQQVNAAMVAGVDQLLATWRERLAGLEPGTPDYHYTAAGLASLQRSLAIIESAPDPAEMIEKLTADIKNSKPK